ncbi:epoxide hydrolase family protein [Nocardia higoensis]|uniref:epoxide hydrolase family protein n=1 Tax=Nocardia higoensis TaxID=228599 RepID=UPI0002E19790|nr:epoxide hydrolase family protein [Nocardia higoensis]
MTEVTIDTAQAVRPFRIDVDTDELTELRRRLTATRWPDRELVDGWQQGPPLAYMKSLCEYWATTYDWKAREARLNEFDHYLTEIDGLDIHFIHAPSVHPDATPIVLTHGWPGSFVEFLDVIEPLRNPTAFGGSADDAMHVIVPSLPGFGFSGAPKESEWNVPRMAGAISELVRRLGYDRYVVNGTDWGAAIAMSLGQIETTDRLLGLCLNLAFANPENYDFEPNAEESEFHARQGAYFQGDNGYAVIQSTRPQTIGYSLDDSPVGQAAWIVDKFASWVDSDGSFEDVVGRDRLLDNIMVYWTTRTGTSSARMYYEAFAALFTDIPPIDCPVTYTRALDIFQISEREARTRFSDLRRYSVAERGGHFLAFERPEIFVEDLRRSVRALVG